MDLDPHKSEKAGSESAWKSKFKSICDSKVKIEPWRAVDTPYAGLAVFLYRLVIVDSHHFEEGLDPHWREKLDPEPDPDLIEKLDPDLDISLGIASPRDIFWKFVCAVEIP